MKTQLALIIIALLCAGVLSREGEAPAEPVHAARQEPRPPEPNPAAEKPIWHADWRTAQRHARKANKPIFAVLVCKH